MDIDTARTVVDAIFRSGGELQKMLPLIRERCSPEEYDGYAKAIAACLAEMSLQVMNRLLAEHPVLEDEIEARVRPADSAAG